MKPTLEERLMATGLPLEKVREWQSIIERIAVKTGEPKKDVEHIILRPLASGEVVLEDCYKLQEIGVPLSGWFMKLVPRGAATKDKLLHELTQLGYNSEKAKKDFTAAFDYGVKLLSGDSSEEAPESEHIEIYSNAVVIDGTLMSIRPESVNLSGHTSSQEPLKVSIELDPKKVSLHNCAYENEQEPDNRA